MALTRKSKKVAGFKATQTAGQSLAYVIDNVAKAVAPPLATRPFLPDEGPVIEFMNAYMAWLQWGGGAANQAFGDFMSTFLVGDTLKYLQAKGGGSVRWGLFKGSVETIIAGMAAYWFISNRVDSGQQFIPPDTDTIDFDRVFKALCEDSLIKATFGNLFYQGVKMTATFGTDFLSPRSELAKGPVTLEQLSPYECTRTALRYMDYSVDFIKAGLTPIFYTMGVAMTQECIRQLISIEGHKGFALNPWVVVAGAPLTQLGMKGLELTSVWLAKKADKMTDKIGASCCASAEYTPLAEVAPQAEVKITIKAEPIKITDPNLRNEVRALPGFSKISAEVKIEELIPHKLSLLSLKDLKTLNLIYVNQLELSIIALFKTLPDFQKHLRKKLEEMNPDELLQAISANFPQLKQSYPEQEVTLNEMRRLRTQATELIIVRRKNQDNMDSQIQVLEKFSGKESSPDENHAKTDEQVEIVKPSKIKVAAYVVFNTLMIASGAALAALNLKSMAESESDEITTQPALASFGLNFVIEGGKALYWMLPSRRSEPVNNTEEENKTETVVERPASVNRVASERTVSTTTSPSRSNRSSYANILSSRTTSINAETKGQIRTISQKDPVDEVAYGEEDADKSLLSENRTVSYGATNSSNKMSRVQSQASTTSAFSSSSPQTIPGRTDAQGGSSTPQPVSSRAPSQAGADLRRVSSGLLTAQSLLGGRTSSGRQPATASSSRTLSNKNGSAN